MYFRSPIDISRRRNRMIQFIIFNFVKKVFFVSTYVKKVVVKLDVSSLGLH